MTIKLLTDNDDDRSVYITGNFNQWKTKETLYKMNKISAGEYEYVFPLDFNFKEPIYFKFTKGDWGDVELDENFEITPNRFLNIEEELSSHKVSNWRFNWGPFKEKYLPIVEIVSEHFEMPQLDKYRKVWALLPYNYYETDKRFPVLYLQDAQNLFNEGSEYGNWEIDKKMSILSEYGKGDVIIIAVDHGGEDRIKEYVFGNNKVVGFGDGKKYIRFISDTLKPFIDKKYRTLSDRDNTGIGGSSLGGLISLYGGLLYPEVYSKLMIFSPSLWAVPRFHLDMIQDMEPFKSKIYFYGGGLEGEEMTEKIDIFSENLKTYEDGFIDFDIRISINPDGKHQEYYWSLEFPKAMEWLFYDSYLDPTLLKKEET